MRSSFVVLVVLCIGTLHSQYYPVGIDFDQRAMSKYDQQQYGQVVTAWKLPAPRQWIKNNEKADFYSLSAALRQNIRGVEKKQALFQFAYPYSRRNASFPLDIANFYFENQKYGYALKWFRRVDEKSLTKINMPKFNFNYGYTLFTIKNYKTARKYLNRIKDNSNYESDAHYYLGHIAYQLDEYESASSSFSRVTKSQQKEDLGYFQVEMNFKLGRFEEAVKLGEKELKRASGATVSQLSKIVGESYFNLKNYTAALPFLEAYEGKKGKWKNIDYYQLGFTHYHLKHYELALAQFNKIIGAKDALAQNAYYLLANCYLQLNKTSAALNALRSAAAMPLDPTIQEDAFLQYAKLSFEIGNPYESVTQLLARFLATYPDHPEKEMLQEVLVHSYTSSRDYKAALALLEAGGNYKNPKILQQVSYLYGLQWYRSGNYAAALSHLEKAATMKEQPQLAANASYWLGQSHYELGNYKAALKNFEELLKKNTSYSNESFTSLEYHIGYCHFQLKDFEAALKAFERQVEQHPALPREYQMDLHLRTGDAHFALKDYWPAMEAYNKVIVIAPQNSYYALYQKGISYGFVARNQQKIETLNSLVVQKTKQNPYVDDALFEVANTYASEKVYSNAIATYNTLLTDYPESPLVPRALLNKGLINYNQENLQEAKQQLQTVATRYSQNSVAAQAINTLKEIAKEEGSVQEFATWLNAAGISSISTSELAQSSFEAAEKQYLDRKLKSAKKLLEEFLLRYPESPNTLTAQFYLGEIHYQEQEWEKASLAYGVLTKGPVNEYTEMALVKAAMALVNNNQVAQAYPLWLQLESIANIEENKRYAKFNLMQHYFTQSEYDKALRLANEVSAYSKLDPKIQWDAQNIIAHAALALQDTVQASAAFSQLEKAPEDALAAEALLFKATAQAQKKNYEASNAIIALISQNHSNSGIWGPKSLLLMAENFYALDDPFQANFILNTLIENFERYPEVQDQAKSLKAQFENEQTSSANDPKTTATDET